MVRALRRSSILAHLNFTTGLMRANRYRGAARVCLVFAAWVLCWTVGDDLISLLGKILAVVHQGVTLKGQVKQVQLVDYCAEVLPPFPIEASMMS